MRSWILSLAAFALLLAALPAMAGGDAAAGQAKASECVDCHGDDGMGDGEETPAIAGMNEADFAAKMNAYRAGEVESDMMNMMAEALSDEDIADLAAYYAQLGK